VACGEAIVDLIGDRGLIQEIQEPLPLGEGDFPALETFIPPAESYSPAHNYEIISDYLADDSYSPSPNSSFTAETRAFLNSDDAPHSPIFSLIDLNNPQFFLNEDLFPPVSTKSTAAT
jgi:hypothetical protein